MVAILPSKPLQSQMNRALVGEFVGTFFLVGTIVVAHAMSLIPPLTIGMQLMTQVFAYGYISGGMYNPAVTTAIHLIKYNRGERAVPLITDWIKYVLVQITGGLSGAFVCWFIIGKDIARVAFPAPAPMTNSGEDILRAFVGELFFTFTLCSIVLNCAVSKHYANDGNHFYGLAIGMSVFSGASCMGKISGAAFNPAVSTALQIVQPMALTDEPKTGHSIKWFWLYWLSEMAAAYIAALVFTLISCEDKDTDEEAALIARENSKEDTNLLTKRNKAASDTA